MARSRAIRILWADSLMSSQAKKCTLKVKYPLTSGEEKTNIFYPRGKEMRI